jgi:hypothetical protein
MELVGDELTSQLASHLGLRVTAEVARNGPAGANEQ